MNSFVRTGFSVGVAWRRAADEAKERAGTRAALRARAERATRDCMVVVVDGRESGNERRGQSWPSRTEQ